MGIGYSAGLPQEVGDERGLSRLMSLPFFDRRRRRRRRVISPKVRTLSSISRLRIQQAGQREPVMLLLVNRAMFFGTKLTVTG